MNKGVKYTRTRLKVTIVTIAFMMVVTAYSLYKEFTDVTVIALGIIGSSGFIYNHSETKRKS